MSRLAQRNFPVRAGILFVVLTMLVLLGGCTLLAGQETIDESEVGVVLNLGRFTGTIGPGWHWLNPVTSDVKVFSTRDYIYETSDDPTTSTADFRDLPVNTTTSDGQQILAVRYTVSFRIPPENAEQIYRRYGSLEAVVDRVVKAISRTTVRNGLTNYEAATLYSGDKQRAETQIADTLRTQFGERGVELTFFGLRDLSFTEEYINTIENQQIAREQAQTETYNTQAAEQRARTLTVETNAQAERQRIEAQARADARRIEAEAEAEANQTVSESLTPDILQLRWLETWDGQLPRVSSGDDIPFLLNLDETSAGQ
jgi:regulator of protease activity HflC (stomatin/prohibitin superfamily)